MPWTQTDYDAVEAAIRAVRDGERKSSLSTDSGALSYVNTPLPDLIKLREAILTEIGATTPTAVRRPRLLLARHRRGL